MAVLDGGSNSFATPSETRCFLALLALAMAPNDNDAYRDFCLKLEGMGVSRKTLGASMGKQENKDWIGRWMNKKRTVKINADQIAGLGRYLDHFQALLAQRPDTLPRPDVGTHSALVGVPTHAETGPHLEQSRASVAAAILEGVEGVRPSRLKDHEHATVAVLKATHKTRRAAPRPKARHGTVLGKGDKSPPRRRKAR